VREREGERETGWVVVLAGGVVCWAVEKRKRGELGRFGKEGREGKFICFFFKLNTI